MKTCTKCGVSKAIDQFHANTKTRDGRCQSCKACACARARDARDRRIDYWRESDRARAQTSVRKHQDKLATRRKRAARHDRYRAHWTVANALLNGTLAKSPCEVCGAINVDGHHDDYSKPLDVRWLCRTHHNEHHAQQMRAIAEATGRAAVLDGTKSTFDEIKSERGVATDVEAPAAS